MKSVPIDFLIGTAGVSTSGAWSTSAWPTELSEREHALDEHRQVAGGHRVVADERGDDLRCESQQIWAVRCVFHGIIFDAEDEYAKYGCDQQLFKC